MLVREIYEKGQIVIPKQIREMLGFEEGTRVALSIEEGRLVIEKEKPVWDEMKEFAQKAKVSKKDLLHAIKYGYDEEIKERTRRSGINVS